MRAGSAAAGAEQVTGGLGGQLCAAGQSELGEDVGQVGLHRRPAHEQGCGDLRVRPAGGTPELAYLQARFAALVSYGITADLLGELLPLGPRLYPAVVRRQTQAVAQRLEDELGEERPSFIDTCQRDREELPRPDLPIVVGLNSTSCTGHISQQAFSSLRRCRGT